MMRVVSCLVVLGVGMASLGCAMSAPVQGASPHGAKASLSETTAPETVAPETVASVKTSPETMAGPRASPAASGEATRRKRPVVYAKTSVCAPGHAKRAGERVADDAGCCYQPTSAWVAESVALGDDVELQPGHVVAACGPTPESGDASRERSLNPSERLRPGNQVLRVGW